MRLGVKAVTEGRSLPVIQVFQTMVTTNEELTGQDGDAGAQLLPDVKNG